MIGVVMQLAAVVEWARLQVCDAAPNPVDVEGTTVGAAMILRYPAGVSRTTG